MSHDPGLGGGVDRHLYLLRHAKSSWDDPSLADHDRPLSPRGRKAAKKVAGHIRRSGIEPDLILCSSALRTRETLDRIAPALRGSPETLIERALYEASGEELLQRLRSVPNATRSVLLIDHNPGLQDLAIALVGAVTPDAIAEKFPTAALATLRVPVVWADLAPGGCGLEDYVVPRELE